MELRNLRAFYLVARMGGLLRAAREIGITPPAVSLRLKQLELEIGVKLFEHRANKLVLTEDGKFFLSHAQRIIDDTDNSLALLHANKGIIAGNVSVALGGDIGHALVYHISAFVKENPRVKLRMMSTPSPNTLELVKTDMVEIGIGRFKDTPRTFKKIHLYTSGLVAIYPKDHPLSASKRCSLLDLASYGLVVHSYNSATGGLIDHVFSKRNLAMKTVIEAGSCFAIKRYVNLGLGVGLIHGRCILGEKEPNLKSSDLTRIFGKQEVSLIYKRNRQLNPAHKRFIEALSQDLDIPKLRRAAS